MNPARHWALATAGLLTRYNEHELTVLGGGPPTPEAVADRLQALKRDWEAGTRQELLDKLQWLAREGHRKVFNDTCVLDVQTTATLEPWDTIEKAIKDEEVVFRIHFTRKHRERIAHRSLLAWDAGRLVTIAGWGYLTQLISEDEAWSFILPMAQAVQRTYASWDEIGKHYMLGREFWSGEWDGELARCHLALLEEASSPWRALPWGLDLGQHGLMAPLQPIVVQPPPPPQPLVKKKFDPLAERGPASQPAPSGGNKVIAIVVPLVMFLIIAGVAASFALGLIDLPGRAPAPNATNAATASAPAPSATPAAPTATHAAGGPHAPAASHTPAAHPAAPPHASASAAPKH
jgi:hypothetical protein